MIKFFQRRWPAIRVRLSDFKGLLFIPLALLAGRLRRRRQIISTWPAVFPQLGPKLVLFMHFDRGGNIRAQLLHYIREFAANGYQVVLITNSGKLNPQAMSALREICAGIIIRRNQGYDFGAWRDAIEYLGLPRADVDELIIANDSVFGPLVPLAPMLARLDYTKADIWGLTESWQYRYHLQSFFLAFGRKAMDSKVFASFWDSVRPVPYKVYIIRAYEIGVTQAMAKGGLSCAALWPYENLVRLIDIAAFKKTMPAEDDEFGNEDPVYVTRKLHVLRLRGAIARRAALNPSADLWRQLLLSGYPFIKRELLRDNPTFVEDVHDWVQVVRDDIGADPEPILQDLRLMLKDGAP